MNINTEAFKENIDAIIFDLGNVIVELDLEKTFSAFRKICNKSQLPIDNFFENEHIKLFEMGKISEETFFSQIKQSLFLQDDIDSIEKAWSLMILGIPTESIKLLRELKQNFSLYALSNTNTSHVKIINQHLIKTHQINNMGELFDKVYYSHELKMSKPDKQIFEHVLIDSNLHPNRTLFIDDNAQNIHASKSMGFHTLHLTHLAKLEQELKRIGVLSNEN